MTTLTGSGIDHSRTTNTWSIPQVLNWTAAAVSTLLPLIRIVDNHTTNGGAWNYSAGDWLINYSQGFVRRGLVGEAIRWMPGFSDLVWLEVAVMALIAAAALLSAVMVQRTITRTSAPWPLLLWLLPTGPIVAQSMHLWQPYWVAGVQFPFRKETAFYVVVCALAVALTGRLGRTNRGLLAASAAVGIALLAGTLTHEGFVLMSCAATSVMTLWTAARIHMPWRLRWVALLLQWIPAGIGMILAVVARGQGLDIAAMWAAVDESTRSWLVSGSVGDFDVRAQVPAAFNYLRAPADDGVGVIRALYLPEGLWRWWLLSVAAAAVGALVVLAMCDASRSGVRRLSTAAAAVAGAALPLFVVAFDWGRFTAAVLTLVTIVAMSGIVGSPGELRPVSARPRTLVAVVGLLALGAAIGIQETGNPQGFLFNPPTVADPR